MKKTNLPKVLESKSSKAYKSKKLNNANFDDFRHTYYQVYLHLISKIGGVDEYGKYLQPEQLKREYILTAKEFSGLFNVSLSNCYGILKQAVDKLMKRDIPNLNHFAHSVSRKLSVIRLANVSNIRGIELSKNSNIAFLKS